MEYWVCGVMFRRSHKNEECEREYAGIVVENSPSTGIANMLREPWTNLQEMRRLLAAMDCTS